MSRRFRMCVIKGGRRCFRPSNGWTKFTLFKKDKKPICCVQIKCISRNFRNWASLLHFFPKTMGRSDLRGQAQLRATKTRSKKCCTPIHIDFLNPECVRIPWVLAPKNFLVENFWWQTNLRKSSVFHWFLLPPPKQKYRASVPTVLMPQTSQIASLNCYTPNFSGAP